MDDNGRIARFLMNVMLVSGGYSWTVIPVEKRNEYMSALEKASVEQNIIDFVQLIAGLADSNNRCFSVLLGYLFITPFLNSTTW